MNKNEEIRRALRPYCQDTCAVTLTLAEILDVIDLIGEANDPTLADTRRKLVNARNSIVNRVKRAQI